MNPVVERRLPAGAPAEFVVPSPRNVTLTLKASLDAVGLPTEGSDRARSILGLERAERVCFVLVDGLGASNLAARSGHAPNLRSFAQLEPLTTVAPSTTAAAITAVGTGSEPGATAMMGYSLRSPLTGRAFSLIKWEEPELQPRAWQRVPTLFESLGSHASECRVIQPAAFIGSGLTEAALRGAQGVAGESLEARVGAAARELRAGARCAYLYWGDLDHTGHNSGWESDEWVAELEKLDAGVGLLARSLPAGTMIVLTSDHGMVDVGARIDVAENPVLCKGVSLMAGEDRAIQLYTDDPEEVAERWRSFLGERSLVLTKEEAIPTGIFGEVGEAARAAMGDVLAFQSGRDTILDSRTRRPGSQMKGVHGSLTSEEMYVPLIVEVV